MNQKKLVSHFKDGSKLKSSCRSKQENIVNPRRSRNSSDIHALLISWCNVWQLYILEFICKLEIFSWIGGYSPNWQYVNACKIYFKWQIVFGFRAYRNFYPNLWIAIFFFFLVTDCKIWQTWKNSSLLPWKFTAMPELRDAFKLHFSFGGKFC